jgi:serine/threonine protein kinase
VPPLQCGAMPVYNGRDFSNRELLPSLVNLMLAPEVVLQNRYRVVRQLGQGGMGTVYEAIDERLDATVALKETFFADERLRKQFEREARLLARMHHPALPRVSDHFAEGEGEFLVMQFITGEDLAHMLTVRQGPFPTEQVLTWADQLLDALDYLHTQDPQIIHRDIKPQNLKLTARGQMILLDFGLAKGQASAISIVTTSASIFGYTPNYAPLEQIQGLGTDPRSDIYALAATLYHLMTGVKPPDALTRAAALVNGQPDPLIPANQVVSGISPQVAGVVARAMSQNREQRYATASEMRIALNGIGEAVTLLSRPEAATVILPAPTPTLAGASRSEARPTALQADATQTGETTVVRPREAGKNRFLPWAMAAAALVLIGIGFGGFYAYQHGNNSATTDQPANNGADQAGPTTQPSAAPSNATQPIAGSLKDEKAANTTVKSGEPARKNEKPGKNVDQIVVKPITVTVQPPTTQAPPAVAERKAEGQNAQDQPNFPDNNDPETPERGGRHKAGIRNLPGGTQVLMGPDGSRIVIFPNGTKRVFPAPGPRPVRRRRLP